MVPFLVYHFLGHFGVWTEMTSGASFIRFVRTDLDILSYTLGFPVLRQSYLQESQSSSSTISQEQQQQSGGAAAANSGNGRSGQQLNRILKLFLHSRINMIKCVVIFRYTINVSC